MKKLLLIALLAFSMPTWAGVLQIKWTASADANNGYRVFVDTTTGLPTPIIDTAEPGLFLNAVVTDGVKYFICVKSVSTTFGLGTTCSGELDTWPRPIITTVTPVETSPLNFTATIVGTNFADNGVQLTVTYTGLTVNGAVRRNSATELEFDFTLASNIQSGTVDVTVKNPWSNTDTNTGFAGPTLVDAFSVTGGGQATVNLGIWDTVNIEFDNTSITGNPYDIHFEALFTRPNAGATTTVPGYYNGGNCSATTADRCAVDGNCKTGETCINEKWVIKFGCDQTGTWSYTTDSTAANYVFLTNSHALTGDTNLNGINGDVECVDSNFSGPLTAEGNNWKYNDGLYTSPIIYQALTFLRDPGFVTAKNFVEADLVNWVRDNGGTFLGTNLLVMERIPSTSGQPISSYGTRSQADQIYTQKTPGFVSNIADPDVSQFWLPAWDAMETAFDLARDDELGIYIRFYQDDADTPDDFSITPDSAAEYRLFRYALARFAGYTTVMWDTGIDISEYRTDAWVNAIVDWFIAEDPWGHNLVGSRESPGPTPTNATHRSDGDDSLNRITSMASTINGRSKPTIFTDHWREDNGENAVQPPCGDAGGEGSGWGRGHWCETISGCNASGSSGTAFEEANSRYVIRGAAWQTALVGTGGAFANLTNCTRYASFITEEQLGTPLVANAFRSAPDIQIRNTFIHGLTNYGNMTLSQALLVDSSEEVYVASDAGDEFIAYVLQAQAGLVFQLDLSTASGNVRKANWLNPTSGVTQSVTDTVTNGTAVTFTPPDTNDWALHVEFGPERVRGVTISKGASIKNDPSGN